MGDNLESESFRRYLERQRRISEIRYSEESPEDPKPGYHSSELAWLIKQNELSLQILGL